MIGGISDENNMNSIIILIDTSFVNRRHKKTIYQDRIIWLLQAPSQDTIIMIWSSDKYIDNNIILCHREYNHLGQIFLSLRFDKTNPFEYNRDIF